VVERLTASYMVPIRRGILSIFMLRDGESECCYVIPASFSAQTLC